MSWTPLIKLKSSNLWPCWTGLHQLSQFSNVHIIGEHKMGENKGIVLSHYHGSRIHTQSPSAARISQPNQHSTHTVGPWALPLERQPFGISSILGLFQFPQKASKDRGLLWHGPGSILGFVFDGKPFRPGWSTARTPFETAVSSVRRAPSILCTCNLATFACGRRQLCYRLGELVRCSS